LSASPSPAPAPCGIPPELEAEVELPPDDEDDVVGAAAPEELDDGVEAGVEDEVDELEEFEPQAATASATKTMASGASRRIEMCVVEVICAPSVRGEVLPFIL
jgi:hypothetical protein